jgi:ribonuclease PH
MASKSRSDESNSMNVKVNVNFPSYYERNFENEKNTIESKLEDLFLNNILVERYAKTKLIINIDVFEFNCDITPYAIMAISMALTHANIEQKGIICSANIVSIEEKIVVDPTLEEEKYANYKLVFGSNVGLQENNLFLQTGSIDESNLKKVLIFNIRLLLLLLKCVRLIKPF